MVRGSTIRSLLLLGWLQLLLPGAAAASPAAEGAQPRRAPTAMALPDDGKPHRHTWVKRTRKEWVPPEKKLVQVGTDAAGKPIYELRIVKPGYWKTIAYEACSCGATKG